MRRAACQPSSSESKASSWGLERFITISYHLKGLGGWLMWRMDWVMFKDSLGGKSVQETKV